jgi:hypothetical protein
MDNPLIACYVISKEELGNLLKLAADDPNNANDFWNRFGYIQHLQQGNYQRAIQEIMALLHQCYDIDPEAYQRCHKGTPFYWLGTAAYLQHDYQTAIFFIDAAFSQDLRIGAKPIINPTPPIYFLTLEGEQPDQAAKILVQDTQAKVQRMIDFYNGLTGRLVNIPDINIESIRIKFLRPGTSASHPELRTLVTAFISFFIEWDFRNEFYDIRPGDGTAEPFFIHLFKGCVLFESLLKANIIHPNPGQTLGRLLNNLSTDLGIASNQDIGGQTLQMILADLPSADNRIETAILITGRVRNTVGHDLGWNVTLSKLEYQRLFQMIASSCLHAINCLY